jgi:hypothetical protein
LIQPDGGWPDVWSLLRRESEKTFILRPHRIKGELQRAFLTFLAGASALSDQPHTPQNEAGPAAVQFGWNRFLIQ